MTDSAPSSPTPSRPGRPPGTRRAAVRRWGRRLFGVTVAVLAALIISFFTVDLGRIPGLKGAAERAASKYLDRTMHIGKLEVRPGRGEYVLRDVVIEGLPGDRPHLTVKTIIVKTSLRTLISRRQLFIDVDVRDWTMRIEKWADHHNLPRYMGPPKDPNKPKSPSSVTYRTSSRASGGTFIYEDHTTPWSVEAPNIIFAMDWSDPDKHYVGNTSFSSGTVRIQDYLPMSADMKTRFVLDGSKVTLPHLDLKTDGATTHVTGNLDFTRWPEQSYTVNSDIDFGRMKQIFFSKESWKVKGQGHFAGVFNIHKEGPVGRDLSGDFTSNLAEVNDLKFPNLHGSLVWLPDRFAVTHADADFLGGDTRFAYAVEPLGTPQGSTQKFVADFERIDLKQIRQFADLKGLELAGDARGHVTMAWPSGHLKDGVSGSGELTATPPAGVTLATNDLAARLGYRAAQTPRVPRPKDAPWPALGALPVGGSIAFRFDPQGMTFPDSVIATPTTFVSLQGRYGYEGATADFPFHVTSRDWQESDRLLAAIITAVTGSVSTPVEVGGIGTFDGRMTGSFKAPRVEGCFTGDEMWAWGVNWGRGQGDVVIENKYLDLANGIITRDNGTIQANGQFALGFPRADGGDEIDASVSLKSWPLADLSVAFGMTDWPIDGTVDRSEVRLKGKYDKGLYGEGPLRIVNGVAWKERFDSASGVMKFKGPTVDIADVEVTKGHGTIRGTSWLGWGDHRFGFDVTGERIAIESLDNFKMERVPLSGVMSLTCSGEGTFERPFYKCTAEAPDLSVGDQGIGQTTAQIVVRDNVLIIDKLAALSNRLNVFTKGTIELSAPYQSSLTADFKDASIDPYMKFVTDKKISDLIHAVVGGTATATGPLNDPESMSLTATITDGTLLIDTYKLTNEGPIEFAFTNKRMRIGRAQLKGENKEVLAISGGFADSNADFQLDGKLGLELLRSPGRVTVSEGTATILATVKGPLDNPVMNGTARIENGQFRWGTLPRLEEINGTLTFDGNGVNADGLRAKIGTGPVTFGGNVLVDLNEFKRSTYDLTAAGRGMVLRYPEGFQSKVDADLTLTGPVMSPTLGGTVTVLSATYLKRFDTDATAILGLTGGADAAVAPPPVVEVPEEGPTLTTDVRINAPPATLRIDNGKGTHIEGSGYLDYKAEGDRVSLLGRIEIDRGFVTWNSNKFVLQNGTIDFSNPTRIEPNFAIAATVRPHAPGQTFDVGVNLSGTTTKLNLNFSSDPWLPEMDIIRLLLGENLDDKTAAETRALKGPQQSDQLIQSAAAQLIASPITSRVVGSVLGDIPYAPTVSISPVVGANITTTATARVVVGKQISSKAYISYMRLINEPQYFVLLEYEQSERLSWILSRNEDRTYALDFRIRHVF